MNRAGPLRKPECAVLGAVPRAILLTMSGGAGSGHCPALREQSLPGAGNRPGKAVVLKENMSVAAQVWPQKCERFTDAKVGLQLDTAAGPVIGCGSCGERGSL